VTVTVYVPETEVVQFSVDVPEVPRVTLVGVRVQLIPVVGDVATVRLTVPVKPPMLATVIVELPDVPTGMESEVGLAVTEKSCTVTVTVAV